MFNIGDLVLEKREIPDTKKTIINHSLGVGIIVKKKRKEHNTILDSYIVGDKKWKNTGLHKTVWQYYHEGKPVYEYDVYWAKTRRIFNCLSIDLMKADNV